jgi:formyl-CoA transferase
LIGRGRTGQGADIRISMFDVMADWLTVPLLNAEGGRPPKRIGLAHPSISPYGVFASRDGAQILISIQNEREWRMFCRDVLQDETIADDPRFCTNVSRVANRAETDGMVARAFGGLPRAEVIDRLTRSDTAFAEVNDMAALSAHPHLRRTTVATPNGPVGYPAPAALFDGASRPCGAVPAIGQNHVDDDDARAAAKVGSGHSE